MTGSVFGFMVVLVAVAAALAQGLVYCARPPSLTRSVIKTAAVAGLALAGLLFTVPGMIVLGLALGALGDWFLSRPSSRAFLAGMGAFAAGHLAYVAAFIEFGAGPPPVLAALILLVLAGSTELWLAPRTGALKAPVRGYVGVIVLMALAALGLPARHGELQAGAVLFLLSDLVLAVEIFVLADGPARRAARHLLWAFYWSGQALILWGALLA